MVGGLRIGKRLKQRMNAHRLAKRREKMDYRSKTWQEIAKNRGALNTQLFYLAGVQRAYRRLWWVVAGSFALYVLLAGRILGWW